MNLYFIVIICVICFFSLLGTLHSMVTTIEKRKTVEALAKMYINLGAVNNENSMTIDEIIKTVNQNVKK